MARSGARRRKEQCEDLVATLTLLGAAGVTGTHAGGLCLEPTEYMRDRIWVFVGNDYRAMIHGVHNEFGEESADAVRRRVIEIWEDRREKRRVHSEADYAGV